RRVKHLEVSVAELDLVAVMKRGERIGHVGSFMNAILRPDAACEFRCAGTVVGMDVGIDDVRQAKTLRVCEFDVGIDVVGPCIDDSALAERAAAEQVGGAAAIVVVVRSEDHCSTPGSPPAATGRPAARHSGKPSFKRRARRPFASSNSTARSAYTQYAPRQHATYSLPLGSSLSRRFNLSTGREIAPGIWPAAYSLAGLASR